MLIRLRIFSLVTVVVLASAPPVTAQGGAGTPAFAPYSVSFAPERHRDLPTSGTVWSLLDTAHPFLISDRIDNGGLWSAEPARIAGYGSSFTQTTFRFDGLDVTDPAGLGIPLVYPDLGVLQGVEVYSATMTAETAGPGPVISLIPRSPSSTWTGHAQFGATPRSWQNASSEIAPSIARFDSYVDGSVLLAGPVGRRLGVVASARVTNTRRLERDAPVALRSDVTSLFARAQTGSASGDQVRVVTTTTSIRRPYAARALFADRNIEERAETTSAQATWDRARDRGMFSLTGGVQRLDIEPDLSFAATGGVIERLRDGPPLALADTGNQYQYRWALGGTFAPSTRRWAGRDHDLRLGAGLNGTMADTRLVAAPLFGELVNGRPARAWTVWYPGQSSHHAAIGANAFVSDSITLRQNLTLNAGVRFEHDNGSARDADNTISWTNISPRVSARWRPRGDGGPAIDVGYGWYRHRLLLDYFGVGDPHGLSGQVYRWDDANANRLPDGPELTSLGPVGLCCAATLLPSVIDPDLRRPTTREFLIGIEHVIGPWRWRITGIDRREHDPIGLVNVGVTAADYTVTFIDDPGVDVAGNSGTGPLPIYNRTSFRQDRYTLTNVGEPSRYQGVEIGVDRELSERWSLAFGGTAYRSEGTGASRGYQANENDQGVLGEAFLTQNAGTFAYGRLFFDRAYVIKVSGRYRAPGDVRLAVASRYQDGQPFSRLVIADGLNQGAEIIQTYPRGGQRFTYTLTLDMKVDKEVRLGRARIGAALEVFNLLNTDNEVEEDIVTGPAFRTITAIQPPRAFRVRLRVGF
jgi:hypothetical protein